MDMKKVIRIFCCYALSDHSLLLELRKHLMPLQQEGSITFWADTDINAGTEWQNEVHHHLNTAHIILLLVSPDFLASPYCHSIETRAMERHERGDAQVIPIIMRPVDWKKASFSKLQVLPKNAESVASPNWHTPDEAFLNIAQEIRRAVETHQSRKAKQVEEEAPSFPTTSVPISPNPLTAPPPHIQSNPKMPPIRENVILRANVIPASPKPFEAPKLEVPAKTPLTNGIPPKQRSPSWGKSIKPQRNFKFPKKFILYVVPALFIFITVLSYTIHANVVDNARLNNIYATATAKVEKATIQAQATATVRAQATVTAQVQATATTQAQATAITLNPNPYGGGGKLVISDSMSGSGSAFHWPTGNSNYGQCNFADGGYHVAGLCNGPGEFLPANFVFEIYLDAVRSCGQLQVGGNNENALFITVCQDGSYSLNTLTDQGKQGSAQQVMHTGSSQSNIIAIVADGTNWTLYINTFNIASISEKSLGNDVTIALEGWDENPTTSSSSDWREVIYTHARLWSL